MTGKVIYTILFMKLSEPAQETDFDQIKVTDREIEID